MIVDTGGTVSLATPVEMMMGYGMPPIQRFLDRGLKPSLSIDVETNVPRRHVQPDAIGARPAAFAGSRSGQGADHRSRRAGVRDDRGRQGERARCQGGVADAGQEGRHHHAAHGSDERDAAQRPGHSSGDEHGHRERRHRDDRRPSHEAGRQAAPCRLAGGSAASPPTPGISSSPSRASSRRRSSRAGFADQTSSGGANRRWLVVFAPAEQGREPAPCGRDRSRTDQAPMPRAISTAKTGIEAKTISCTLTAR